MRMQLHKRVTSLFTLLIFVMTGLYLYAAPRAWSVNPQSTGYTIASNAAQLYTATTNVKNFVACDDAAVGGQAIFIDYTGTTAAGMTTTASTSIKIQPQECYSVTIDDPNVSNAFTVAIMTAAATADFRLIGERR